MKRSDWEADRRAFKELALRSKAEAVGFPITNLMAASYWLSQQYVKTGYRRDGGPSLKCPGCHTRVFRQYRRHPRPDGLPCFIVKPLAELRGICRVCGREAAFGGGLAQHHEYHDDSLFHMKCYGSGRFARDSSPYQPVPAPEPVLEPVPEPALKPDPEPAELCKGGSKPEVGCAACGDLMFMTVTGRETESPPASFERWRHEFEVTGLPWAKQRMEDYVTVHNTSILDPGWKPRELAPVLPEPLPRVITKSAVAGSLLAAGSLAAAIVLPAACFGWLYFIVFVAVVFSMAELNNNLDSCRMEKRARGG